jgi:hypothetical protein
MSVSFPQTMRSLKSENIRPSLFALIIIILLLAGWFMWFFFANVPVYQASTDLTINREGLLVATYSKQVASKIRLGQPVTLKLKQTTDHAAANLNGVVMDILKTTDEKYRNVEIYLFSPEEIPSSPSGQVMIEVDSVSPASLVVESTGQLLQDNDY